MKNQIKSLILSGDFSEAQKKLKPLGIEMLQDILLAVGYDEQNICSYGFICFLLREQETAAYHCAASALLELAFPHLDGAFTTALYHTRRAIELSPSDMDVLAKLLFFNDYPTHVKLVSDHQAEQVARAILLKEPNNEAARNFLPRLT
jgi:hypothetical protein